MARTNNSKATKGRPVSTSPSSTTTTTGQLPWKETAANRRSSSSTRSASMALTTSTATLHRRSGQAEALTVAHLERSDVHSLPLTPTVGDAVVVSIPLRKRTRPHTAGHSAESDFIRSGRNSGSGGRVETTPSHPRSPSAVAITAGVGEVDAMGERQLHLSGQRGGNDSSHHQHRQQQRARMEEVEEDIFVDSTGSHSPLQHLQGTPTSQLLSQLQDPPYAATSDEKAEEAVAAALFTPVTVPRRRAPLLGAALEKDEAAPLSPSTSGSRSSVHDAAVQAILRANPPTTTRAVELKPGYHAPSPRSPLWAALDAEEEGGASTAGRRSDEGAPWMHTQVSLFLEEEEERREAEAAGAAAARHVHVPTLTATQERRRLSSRRAPHDRVSLPAAGRSVNLLDEEGESFVISLTQEAVQQEREQDQHAALPRSRNSRVHSPATAAALKKQTLPATPSPARRSAGARRHRTAQQASPFSQLQRDVHHASEAAVAAANPSRSASPLSTNAAAGAVLSQRELRRRADMLKWAERTRAFFHFIDSLPLHVTSSPLKPTSPAPSRRSRSQTIAAAAAAAAVSVPRAPAASMSLVRRSRSAATAPPAAGQEAYRSSGSSAFEAVVSRVKKEAAAKRQESRHRSTTAASRTSAS